MVLLLPGSGAVRPAYGLSYKKLNGSSAGSSRAAPPASSTRPRPAPRSGPARPARRGRATSTSRPTAWAEYWQGAGDPAVATDTRGNTYFSCLQFNRGQPTTPVADASSAIYLYLSTGNAGASWNFPGRAVVETADVTGISGVLQDKELLAVDNHRRSPFRDRVYVTWTEFAADGTAYIWLRASAGRLRRERNNSDERGGRGGSGRAVD